MTMVSLSTKVHSEMHSAFVMAGHCHQPQSSATVAQPSQQTPTATPVGNPYSTPQPLPLQCKRVLVCCSRRIFWCEGFPPECAHAAIAPEPSKLPTRNTRTRKGGLTANASETLSKGFSPPSSSNPQMDWGKRPPHFASDEQKILLWKKGINTLSWSTG